MTGKLDVREAAAQRPEESGEEEPIDGDGFVTENMGDNVYDATQPEEELEIESEVTA